MARDQYHVPSHCGRLARHSNVRRDADSRTNDQYHADMHARPYTRVVDRCYFTSECGYGWCQMASEWGGGSGKWGHSVPASGYLQRYIRFNFGMECSGSTSSHNTTRANPNLERELYAASRSTSNLRRVPPYRSPCRGHIAYDKWGQFRPACDGSGRGQRSDECVCLQQHANHLHYATGRLEHHSANRCPDGQRQRHQPKRICVWSAERLKPRDVPFGGWNLLRLGRPRKLRLSGRGKRSDCR